MKTLVSVAIGEKYQAIASWTFPIMDAYAKKIGADFRIITEVRHHGTFPMWEKLQVGRLLDSYDRVAFVDADIVIRPWADDLFKVVPSESFGIHNEAIGKQAVERLTWLRAAMKRFRVQGASNAYYNTGVMVFSKRHKITFGNPPAYHDGPLEEQNWINVNLCRWNIGIFNLPSTMNFVRPLYPDENLRRDAQFMHYATYPTKELDELHRDVLFHYPGIKQRLVGEVI